MYTYLWPKIQGSISYITQSSMFWSGYKLYKVLHRRLPSTWRASAIKQGVGSCANFFISQLHDSPPLQPLSISQISVWEANVTKINLYIKKTGGEFNTPYHYLGPARIYSNNLIRWLFAYSISNDWKK